MAKIKNIKPITDSLHELPIKEPSILKKTTGQILKRARLEQGFKINQVVQKLNISEHYIKAIESNEYEKLPSELTYTLGFIRAYAQLMGLDAIGLINKYKIECTTSNHYITQENELLKTCASSETSSSFSKILIGFGIVIGIIYLINHLYSKDLKIQPLNKTVVFS